VHSAAFIALRAGCVITHWDGAPVRFTPDIHAVYSLVCSANATLHRQVLRVLKTIQPRKDSRHETRMHLRHLQPLVR